MIKRIMCVIASVTMIFTACIRPVAAEETAAVSSNEAVEASDEVGLYAPSALLMDNETGKVLYEKNAHEQRPCASITKVMTMCLVFEAIESGKLSYDTVISASPVAAAQEGSDIWLVEGEQMTVDDLLKAVAVVSANDAAVALAEAVSGSREAFVKAMNEKACVLGMKDTVFKNCNGLDEEGHLTSAYDVALMSRELMKHEKVFSYVNIWLDYIRDGETQLVNTNRLLKSYDGITGLKTGTTSKAGACISATAKRGDMHLIAVILGDKTTDDRFYDAAKLLDYGFGSFCSVEPTLPDELPVMVDVENGMESSVAVQCVPDKPFLVKYDQQENIVCDVRIADKIPAPVSAGQSLGSVIYRLDGNIIGEFPITASQSVNSINFPDVFKIMLNCFIK